MNTLYKLMHKNISPTKPFLYLFALTIFRLLANHTQILFLYQSQFVKLPQTNPLHLLPISFAAKESLTGKPDRHITKYTN